MCQLHDYFRQIAAIHSDVLNTLAQHWSSQEALYTAILQQRDDAIAQTTHIQRPIPEPKTPTRGVGLNTIGLLSDRLTILVIKEWFLRHHHHDNDRATVLYETSTLDIIDTLTVAFPAKGALNVKLTLHQPTIHVTRWEEAFYDLFATNVLIWHGQEICYVNTGDASIEQLQNYMRWVPKLNIQRDELIQRCEQLYWQASRERVEYLI
ncbi:MAG: hypothetical protein AAGA75_20725 [Cyanobacteria bacterium P01_E01_bin.6]